MVAGVVQLDRVRRRRIRALVREGLTADTPLDAAFAVGLARRVQRHVRNPLCNPFWYIFWWYRLRRLFKGTALEEAERRNYLRCRYDLAKRGGQS